MEPGWRRLRLWNTAQSQSIKYKHRAASRACMRETPSLVTTGFNGSLHVVCHPDVSTRLWPPFDAAGFGLAIRRY